MLIFYLEYSQVWYFILISNFYFYLLTFILKFKTKLNNFRVLFDIFYFPDINNIILLNFFILYLTFTFVFSFFLFIDIYVKIKKI